jgi:hypothetical protein
VMTDVCLIASQSDYKHKMEGGLTGIEINGVDRGKGRLRKPAYRHNE